MSNKFKWYSSFSNYVQHLQRNLWDNRNITKSFIVVSGVTAHRVQCTLTVKHLKLQFFFLAIQNFNSVLNKDSDFSVYDKLYNDNAFLDALRNVKDFLSIRTFFNRGDRSYWANVLRTFYGNIPILTFLEMLKVFPLLSRCVICWRRPSNCSPTFFVSSAFERANSIIHFIIFIIFIL